MHKLIHYISCLKIFNRGLSFRGSQTKYNSCIQRSLEHQYTPDDFRPLASFLFTSKDWHHLNWLFNSKNFPDLGGKRGSFLDVSHWNVIGTRESVIQYVFRFTAFFVTKSLGNIFGLKGKRIENTLGGGERLQDWTNEVR